MSQTKIYPSTQEQVAAVDAKLDIINGKLPLPQYQVKTVNPSNVQQTVTPDNNYAGLSGVVVNPISALMPANLEDYILRKDTMPEFTLSLSGDVPDYACYNQTKLVEVYGTPTSIGKNAFSKCTSLNNIDGRSLTSLAETCFEQCSSLNNIDIRQVLSVKGVFRSCISVKYVDCRNLTKIGYESFFGCSSLNILDFTNVDTAPTLTFSNAFSNTNATWKAVFKNDTVKAAVQTATNWSYDASHIYTVAEIEALYGDTYDNLYLQWFGHARNEVSA